jgi:hypothetical protein
MSFERSFVENIVEVKCDVCKKLLDEQEIKECVCDACDRALCTKCENLSYYSMRHCEDCGETYCYYDGLHSDYACEKKETRDVNVNIYKQIYI